MEKKSEAMTAWQVAPATRDACVAVEKMEMAQLRALFDVCKKSTDPAVRYFYSKVETYEAQSRFMGSKGMLSEILTGEVQ